MSSNPFEARLYAVLTALLKSTTATGDRLRGSMTATRSWCCPSLFSSCALPLRGVGSSISSRISTNITLDKSLTIALFPETLYIPLPLSIQAGQEADRSYRSRRQSCTTHGQHDRFWHFHQRR